MIKIKRIYLFILIMSIPLMLTTGFVNNSNNPIKKSIKDIEWVTVRGGALVTHRDVLFPEKDKIKIEKLLKMLESGAKYQKLKINEYPSYRGLNVSIIFKTRDGIEFSISPAIKYTIKGNGRYGKSYEDRVIIAIQKNNLINRYVMFSQSMANYFNKKLSEDFPIVKLAIANPSEFKIGDKIVISGRGCVEDVKIYLSNSNSGGNEQYLIGSVKPILGVWKWEGILSKDIKTWDGKIINFKKDKYNIIVLTEGNGVYLGQPLNFEENQNR